MSIQFSLGGFSFCISNSKEEVYQFTSYQFEEKANSPETILEKLKEVFKTDQSLQDEFESVQVIHQNNLNALVPNPYFKEDALKSYLKYSIRTITTDLIVYDELDDLQMKNVYIPYVNINNFLFQNFGEFEYKHHASLLIKKLITKSDEGSMFYVNVHHNLFDIVVIEDQKLLFYNSFEFTTKEDFIYYILFTLEQLKFDPEVIATLLLGDIDETSELYQIAFEYIRNLDFLSSNSSVLDVDQGIHQHSNFILLG